jgi:hypothetical protein
VAVTLLKVGDHLSLELAAEDLPARPSLHPLLLIAPNEPEHRHCGRRTARRRQLHLFV